jgi:hypothetical protein
VEAGKDSPNKERENPGQENGNDKRHDERDDSGKQTRRPGEEFHRRLIERLLYLNPHRLPPFQTATD